MILKDQQLDMTNVWYDAPHHVRFLDVESGPAYLHGIAFHEYVVELSTGRAYRCQDILKNAAARSISLDDAIIEYGGWIDLTEVFRMF